MFLSKLLIHKLIIILYPNQDLLVDLQRNIIETTIMMLFRNYYIDSKHVKPKKDILILQKTIIYGTESFKGFEIKPLWVFSYSP